MPDQPVGLSETRKPQVIDLRILPYQKGLDTYEMPVHCGNCDWRGVALVPRGEEAPGWGGSGRSSVRTRAAGTGWLERGVWRSV